MKSLKLQFKNKLLEILFISTAALWSLTKFSWRLRAHRLGPQIPIAASLALLRKFRKLPAPSYILDYWKLVFIGSIGLFATERSRRG